MYHTSMRNAWNASSCSATARHPVARRLSDCELYPFCTTTNVTARSAAALPATGGAFLPGVKRFSKNLSDNSPLPGVENATIEIAIQMDRHWNHSLILIAAWPGVLVFDEKRQQSYLRTATQMYCTHIFWKPLKSTRL